MPSPRNAKEEKAGVLRNVLIIYLFIFFKLDEFKFHMPYQMCKTLGGMLQKHHEMQCNCQKYLSECAWL